MSRSIPLESFVGVIFGGQSKTFKFHRDSVAMKLQNQARLERNVTCDSNVTD